MADEFALIAEIEGIVDDSDALALRPERDFEAGLISAMRAAGLRERAANRKRHADSDTPIQSHLRQRFLDAQGTSVADSKARELRVENARRYSKWAASSALSATGNRPI